MKKTFKRIIALAIVLCTLGAMMIPGVNVATAATTWNGATTYSLYSEAVGVGVGSSQSIIDHQSGSSTASGHGGGYAPLKTAFDAGTIGFMVDSADASVGTSTYSKFGGSYIRLTCGSSYDTGMSSAAFRVKAPATGNFQLSVAYGRGSYMEGDIARYVKGYIFEAPEESFNNKNYGAGSLNDFVAGKVFGTATDLISFTPYDASAAAGTGTITTAASNGNTAYMEEGKHYLIVFAFTNKGDDPSINIDSTGNTRVYLNSITLTKIWDVADNYDLNVDFRNDLKNNANIPGSTYITQTTAYMNALDTAYADGLNKWTLYRKNGQTVHSVKDIRAYSSSFEFDIFAPKTANTPGYVPLLFNAPGTGEYTLYITDSAVKWAADVNVSAYVLKVPAGGFTADTLKTACSEATSLINYNPTVDKPGAVPGVSQVEFTFKSDYGAVQLIGGHDYVLVIGVQSAKASAEIFLKGFALKEFKPVANVGENRFPTLDEAITAAAGTETVKLISDVAVEGALDMGGATLDLNGKTLTVSGAVDATVIDSENGEGLLAASQDAIVTTTESQIALWDSTTDASGYRVFNYIFDRYVGENSEVQDSTFTNDPAPVTYNVYSDAVKGAYLNPNLPTWYDNYQVSKTANWRFEATAAAYYVRRNNTGFSYMNSGVVALSIRMQKGIFAFRFRNPGAGNAEFTLTYGTFKEGTDDADVYILPASVVDNALMNEHGITGAAAGEVIADAYATSTAAPAWPDNETGINGPAYQTTILSAITTAMETADAVIEEVNFYSTSNKANQTRKGNYTFGDEEEYILVFNSNKIGPGGSYGGITMGALTFDHEPTTQNVRTFWSTLEFSNNRAYQIAEASDLKVGFDLYWNYQDGDQPGMSPVFTSTQIGQWANKQIIEGDQGFFVRVSGFEKLLESGDVKVVPFISVKNDKRTGSAMTYHYDLPTVEPTE